MFHCICPSRSAIGSGKPWQSREGEDACNSGDKVLKSAELKKWYFAVNQRGLERQFGLIRVAVVSCRASTGLAPHCLYCGKPGPGVQQLRRLGVNVIFREPSLKPDLQKAYGNEYEQFAGHWLRVDIPQIETEEEFILYTDIDVLFRGLPEQLQAPKLLSIAPEHHKGDWRKFNSGVMLMNLPALREVSPDFKGKITERLRNNFSYPTHDQKSFIDYFRGSADPLPLTMNWKPYWGENADANIVHFHGPKPGFVRAMRDGRQEGSPDMRTIWQRDTQAYDAYIAMFDKVAKKGLALVPSEPPALCQIIGGAPTQPSDKVAAAGRAATTSYYRSRDQIRSFRKWLRTRAMPPPRS